MAEIRVGPWLIHVYRDCTWMAVKRPLKKDGKTWTKTKNGWVRLKPGEKETT